MDEDSGPAPSARSVYAAAAAGCGVGIGASLVVALLVGGQAGPVTGVVIWVLLLAGVLRLEKKLPTAPEEFRRWTRIGFGTSVLLYLAAAMPWLGSRDEVGWGLLLLAALIVAAPCLIVGARIGTSHD